MWGFASIFSVLLVSQSEIGDYEKQPVVFLSQFEKTERLPLIKDDNLEAPLLPDSLIIKAGTYRIKNWKFNVMEGGRLLVVVPEEENQFRVVWNKDIYQLMSGLSWVHIHGTRHENVPTNELEAIAKKTRVSLTCSRAVNWVIRQIAPLRISARLVSLITLERWNGFDDGHSMVEVWIPNERKWVAFDLTTNRYFKLKRQSLGYGLDLFSFVEALKHEDPDLEFVPLATKRPIDWSAADENFDYTPYTEAVLADSKNERTWFKRVAQVGLQQGPTGKWYFYDFENRERIQSYSPSTFDYMPMQEWINKFKAPPPGLLLHK